VQEQDKIRALTVASKKKIVHEQVTCTPLKIVKAQTVNNCCSLDCIDELNNCGPKT